MLRHRLRGGWIALVTVRREISTVLLLATLVLAAAGCTEGNSHSEEPMLPPPPAPIVEPAQPPLSDEEFALAGIRPGMSLDEVRQVFPAAFVERGENEEIWWLTRRREGFIIAGGDRAVTVVLKQMAEGAAPRGVRVGDRMSQVLMHYGQPLREVSGKRTYLSPSGVLTLSVHYAGEPLSPASTVYSVVLSSLARN